MQYNVRKVGQDPKIDLLDGSERVFIALDLFGVTPCHHHRSEPGYRAIYPNPVYLSRSISVSIFTSGKRGRGTDPMAPT